MSLRDLPLIITAAGAGAAIASIFLWPSSITVTIAAVLVLAVVLQVALAAREDARPDKPRTATHDDALRRRLTQRRQNLKEKP